MLGFDLQEVERIGDEERLLQRIALESEIEYIHKFQNSKERVACLWAVKEAVFKALNAYPDEISYREIELCHKENGSPFVKLYGKARAVFEKNGFTEIEISISHQKSVVGAVVLTK